MNGIKKYVDGLAPSVVIIVKGQHGNVAHEHIPMGLISGEAVVIWMILLRNVMLFIKYLLWFEC